MTGYQDYLDVINQVTPEEKANRVKVMEEENITKQDYDWKEPGLEGNATVWLKDGSPWRIDYYVWKMDDDQPLKRLNEIYGELEVLMDWGGNGHCGAYLRRKP